MFTVERYRSDEVTSCPVRDTNGRCVGLSASGRMEYVRPAAEITYIPPSTLDAASRLPYAFVVAATTPVRRRVDLLQRLVEQDMEDPKLTKIAADCLRAADGTPRGVAQTILDWQNKEIAYEYDPGHLEVFQSPRYTLERAAADCEDKATFFACVATIAGMFSHACWVSQPRSKNNHVAPRVCLTWLHGQRFDYVPAPWDYDDQHDHYDLEVTCPMVTVPACKMVWGETTLNGSKVGEHPYDALRRVRTMRPERASL